MDHFYFVHEILCSFERIFIPIKEVLSTSEQLKCNLHLTSLVISLYSNMMMVVIISLLVGNSLGHNITISEDNYWIPLNCILNENNSFVWFKDQQKMSFDKSVMRLSLEEKKSDNQLVAHLVLMSLSGHKDRAIYECNGNVIQLNVNSRKGTNSRTEETKSIISLKPTFFNILKKNFEIIFVDIKQTITRFVKFYASLGLKSQIIFVISQIILVSFAILIKLIALIYNKSALNYAKIQHILQQRNGIRSEDSETTDEEEDKLDHYLEDGFNDYSFICLMNDI